MALKKMVVGCLYLCPLLSRACDHLFAVERLSMTRGGTATLVTRLMDGVDLIYGADSFGDDSSEEWQPQTSPFMRIRHISVAVCVPGKSRHAEWIVSFTRQTRFSRLSGKMVNLIPM